MAAIAGGCFKVMEGSGELEVDDFLRMKQHDGSVSANAFALGDCAHTKQSKMAFLAGEQAKIVVKNIKAHAAGKDATALPPGPQAIIVPFGPNGGAAQLPMGGGKVMGPKVSK